MKKLLLMIRIVLKKNLIQNHLKLAKLWNQKRSPHQKNLISMNYLIVVIVIKTVQIALIVLIINN